MPVPPESFGALCLLPWVVIVILDPCLPALFPLLPSSLSTRQPSSFPSARAYLQPRVASLGKVSILNLPVSSAIQRSLPPSQWQLIDINI
ncbi:hypothetical protein F4861DRAFT_481261 [Xylaria intraflava]|nr:hypothetical protein F4861DRAFT_481261 [Xylaria intraflava]